MAVDAADYSSRQVRPGARPNAGQADGVYSGDYADDDAAPRGGPGAGLVHMVGAAVSLALLIGVTVWAYQLITRDVSGVPVVRAAEGPMRVQPDSPGGAVADHQGLSVNAVAAVGTASAPADRLILAPPPLDLSQDDIVPAPDAETAGEAKSETFSETDAAVSDALDDLQLAAVEALATSLANGVDPISPDEARPLEAESDDAIAGEGAAPAVEALASAAPVEGGLGRSLRPQVRPLGLGGVPQPVAASDIPVDDIDPETLPVGTRLAQLGAFASADIARAEWDKLSEKFSDYLSDKGRVIQKATSGGRTFYRLRAAGFDDISDARRFCSALVAERAECIPVVTR